jgi:hypothetical protein
MLIWHKQPNPMGTLAVAQWARINDVRLSRFSLVSDHAVYRAIAWSSRRRLRAADHSSLPPELNIVPKGHECERWPPEDGEFKYRKPA